MRVDSSSMEAPAIVALLLSRPWNLGEDQSNARKRPVTPGDGVARQSVLVVDDEDMIADSLAEILNRSGFKATACYCGKSAIQYIARECPDIIISDVMMPDCNGIQLAKLVRQHCPRSRIVLFTGNAATPGLLNRATDDGYFFELLPKPIHPVKLLQALRS